MWKKVQKSHSLQEIDEKQILEERHNSLHMNNTLDSSQSSISKSSESDADQSRDINKFFKEEQQKDFEKLSKWNIRRKKLSLYNKTLCYQFYKNKYFQMLLNTLTVIVLIGYSIKGIVLNADFNIFYDAFIILCVVVFVFELYINLTVEIKYFLSFFFWLDIISIFIFTLDLRFYDRWIYYNYNNSGSATFQLLRVIHNFRLARITRFIKLLANVSLKPALREKYNFAKASQGDPEMKISEQLKSNNLKNITLIILMMVLLVPLLDFTFWSSYSIYNLEDKAKLATQTILLYPDQFEAIIQKMNNKFDNYKRQILKFSIENKFLFEDKDLKDRVKLGLFYYNHQIVEQGELLQVEIIIGQYFVKRLQSILDILNILVVSMIMWWSIKSINTDFNELIIKPLNSLITKIRQVSLKPYQKFKDLHKHKYKTSEEFYELVINRISSMIIICLGKQSEQILNSLLKSPLVPIEEIIPKQQMKCVYVYIHINNQRLKNIRNKDKVTKFMNRIAETIYNVVDFNQGHVNKNYGTSFLLVWEAPFQDDKSGFSIKEDSPFLDMFIQLAILSCIKIIVQIKQDSNSNEKYKEFRNIQDFIHFGIHFGQSEKGPVGSPFKLMPSYVSLKAVLSQKLSFWGQKMNTKIVFNQKTFKRLIQFSSLRDNIREIFRGYEDDKMQILYTIDFSDKKYDQKIYISDKSQRHFMIKIIQKKIFRHIFQKNISQEEQEDTQIIEDLDEHLLSIIMHKNYHDLYQNLDKYSDLKYHKFRKLFQIIYEKFLKKEWNDIQETLSKTILLRPNDGPTRFISLFIYNNIGMPQEENYDLKNLK